MTDNISYYISKFFQDELGNIKECSINTKKSYRDSVVQLLSFVSNKKGINSNLKIDDFSADLINDFINYLRNEKNLSISTCNLRLIAIKELFKFIQLKNVDYFELCSNIIKIEHKKKEEPIIKYLSINEITKLFEVFNFDDNIEYRHFMILTTLYETAARVQELCDLKVCDVNIINNSITLTGKGKTTRVVPIGKALSNNLKEYIENLKLKKDEVLFKNRKGQKLTRVGVQYIIDKYVDIARNRNNDLFTFKPTNHTFRHSKAMHMLEAGVNLVYIRDILGHVSVTTTEIYAKCSLELKKKELEKNHNDIQPEITYSEEQQEDLINWLKNNI